MKLAEDLLASLDPCLLAEALGLELDPWQKEVLRSGEDRLLLCCARQTGKSTVVALLALHEALYRPGSLVLMLSPSLRQSQELFRKALGFYRSLERPVGAEAESRLSLELESGSRIVSLPGKENTIRGFSGVRLLAIDEAARVPDDLYYSTRPMLAVSGGRLVALSTPFGTRGWFYEAWQAEGWRKWRVTAEDCPRISQEFLDEERRSMGEWWFRQEYYCEFLEAETQAFRRQDVEAAFDDSLEAWEL